MSESFQDTIDRQRDQIAFMQAQLEGERKNIAGWIAARDANLKRAEFADRQLDEVLAGCRETNARALAAEAKLAEAEKALSAIANHVCGSMPDAAALMGAIETALRIAELERPVVGAEVYESARTEPSIKVRGVGRDLFEPRSASVALTERPTNEELISLHEYLRGWKP